MDVRGLSDGFIWSRRDDFTYQIEVLQSMRFCPVFTSDWARRHADVPSGSVGFGDHLAIFGGVNKSRRQEFANTVAEVYIDYMYSARSFVKHGIDLLRDQLKEVQTNRMKAMNDLLKFKEEHGSMICVELRFLIAQRNVLETKLFDAEMDMDELEMTLQRSRRIARMHYHAPICARGESGNFVASDDVVDSQDVCPNC